MFEALLVTGHLTCQVTGWTRHLLTPALSWGPDIAYCTSDQNSGTVSQKAVTECCECGTQVVLGYSYQAGETNCQSLINVSVSTAQGTIRLPGPAVEVGLYNEPLVIRASNKDSRKFYM